LSSDFPLANSFQPSNVGGQDGFIAKINADDIIASKQFTVTSQGGATLMTSAQTSSTTFGYAVADIISASGWPAGLALIDLRSQGLLVSDLGLPVTPFSQAGRLFVEFNDSVSTAVSIVNSNSDEVAINFDYTNFNGDVSNFGTFTIAAGNS